MKEDEKAPKYVEGERVLLALSENNKPKEGIAKDLLKYDRKIGVVIDWGKSLVNDQNQFIYRVQLGITDSKVIQVPEDSLQKVRQR